MKGFGSSCHGNGLGQRAKQDGKGIKAGQPDQDQKTRSALSLEFGDF